jgi:pyruvate,water dikinase
VAYTRLLAELRRSDAVEFGAKSANLGDMLAAGIPVPPGFAVGADAFRAFVEATGLRGTIAAALSRTAGGDLDAVNAASKTIGEAMRFAPLPGELRAELARRYGELGGDLPPVAVRSSALGEDSAKASHAGQQESFLWVRGVDELCDAVRDCWASLYTPHAISYRAALTGTQKTAMGVTVQSMVDAEVSGVLFSCNPVSGDPSMVAINACWGLGVAVVGGEVTPDDYLVSKITGELVQRTIGSKHIEYVPDAAGRGTVRAEVDGARRDAPCLDEPQIAALVEVARRIETHFGSHQDVEWAIPRGQDAVIVLQARPVTTLPERAPKLSVSALSLVMSTFGAPGESGSGT